MENRDQEALAAFLKGVISTIPVLGGILAEVGSLYFNPLEKRKQEWINQVSIAIEEIKSRFNLLPVSLESDQRFVSFLYQATIIALKNHQQEKIIALRNAIVSVASPSNIADDVYFKFLQYVDDLSVTHILMLQEINKKIDYYSGCKSMDKIYDGVINGLSIPIDRVVFRSFINDLDAKFLLRIGDIDDFPEFDTKKSFIVLEKSSIKPLEVTSLGQGFLRFINQNQT